MIVLAGVKTMNKIQVTTFQPPSYFRIQEHERFTEPKAFNGNVLVKRYKVTIEEIQEPDEVILERLKALYKNETNHYTRNDLERYARINFDVDLEGLSNNDNKNIMG